MIQISNNRTIRTGPAQSFAAAREHFDTRGYLKLAGLIEPGFLSRILEAIDRATFYERVHEGIGVELCAAPGAAAGALALACNDPALFELVAELTGCGRIGFFDGRIYRLRPGAGDYDSWHSDVADERLIAMSINVGREPFEGGVLQIRRSDSSDVLAEVANPMPGDAVIFRIDPQLRHRVGPLQGRAPRTAYAGWFRRHPDFRELLGQILNGGNP